ncbi:cell division protein DedD [Candidatus Woesearchaeota archaeon]|nr:MAG: cell division protein DedD [Candidatus Woesearchaeota archaeon]
MLKFMYQRPTWDEYFMQLVEVVAKRGTCDRGRTGAVIVKDKRILSTGYVGSPPKLPHCDEAGHLMKTVVDENGNESKHCLRTLHAEMSAIAWAAKQGISLDGSTLYCKMSPCFHCAKMIVSSGIKRVVCKKRYHADKESMELFEKAGVEVQILNNEIETYDDQ